MGFMDNLKGQLGAAVTNAVEAHGGLTASVLNMVNAHPGGLAGLVQSFQQHGLGGVVQSWISTGPNQPVTAEQIQQVLGNERLQAFATQHGIDTGQVRTQLAQLLPIVVDKLTPHGTLPAETPVAPPRTTG